MRAARGARARGIHPPSHTHDDAIRQLGVGGNEAQRPLSPGTPQMGLLSWACSTGGGEPSMARRPARTPAVQGDGCWDLRTWTSDTLRDVGSAQRVSLADATQMMNEIA